MEITKGEIMILWYVSYTQPAGARDAAARGACTYVLSLPLNCWHTPCMEVDDGLDPKSTHVY